MRLQARIVTVPLASALFTMALASPAAGWEDVNGGDQGGAQSSTDGGIEGGTLTAEATDTQIVVTESGGEDGEGNLTTSGDTDWTPPICWYEPYMTPTEFETEVERLAREDDLGRLATNVWASADVFKDIYRDNKADPWGADETYTNYNLDKEGEGMWWRGVINPNREDEFTYGVDCTRWIYWDDTTESSDPNAITSEKLAEYAYDEVSVPETQIEMNPEDEQIVNLDTWIWLDDATFEPVTARAELASAGIWAEVTATPVSLTIDPGTDDATLHPSDGTCEINDDGSIGQPYTEGRSEDTPPCGITYERATHATGSYELTATITWEVTWEGSNSTGGDLPNGVFETTHDITVEEVQTIVR